MDPELLSLLFGGIPGMTGPVAAMPQTVAGGAPIAPMAVPPTLAPPLTRPIEPYMTDPLAMGTPTPQMPTMAAQPASLGASLEPTIPFPRPRPPEAPGGTYGAQGPMGGNDPSKIAAALKGVVAPQAPQAQKVGTPHAPTLGKLQGGNVAELLAQLGIGPQQAFPGLKLPSTLGQALGGR